MLRHLSWQVWSVRRSSATNAVPPTVCDRIKRSLLQDSTLPHIPRAYNFSFLSHQQVQLGHDRVPHHDNTLLSR